jgi:intracellular multiplication protein IcmL
MRNDWQRDVSHKALTIAIASVLVAGGALATAVTAVALKPDPAYFAVDEGGRIVPIIPVSNPLASSSSVSNWAATAVTETLSIDFLKYRDQLSKVADFYTPEGFDEYLKGLQDSGNLTSIQQNKYVVQAVVDGAPRIIGEGVLNGRYSYKISMPLLVSYQSSKEQANQRIEGILLVVRVPQERSRSGLAIHQFVQRPR